MGAVSIQQMADRVADLLQTRLRIRGNGLAEKLKRGGRVLPRTVRKAASALAQAADQAENPRLMMQLDLEKVAADYDLCLKHLNGIGARDRRIGMVLDFGARLALIVLVVGALLLAVLYWRGFLGGS
jgi:hypothetical protein